MGIDYGEKMKLYSVKGAKIVISSVLIFTLIISLCSCGNGKNYKSDENVSETTRATESAQRKTLMYCSSTRACSWMTLADGQH